MPKPAHNPRSQRGSSTIRIVIAVLALALIGGVAWFTGSRIRQLNRDLAKSEKHAEEVNARLRQYSEDLEKTLRQVRAARTRAEVAEDQVEQTTEALREAEETIDDVTAERERALADASRASAESAMTRQELEAVRQRRKAELDRMQEALNKIAPTKRTPAGMVMMLSERDFRFEFDKATLSAENKETLSRIAGILLASEGYRLFVDGHTDDIGDAAYNMGLSERRAISVRDYLVKAGIPSESIEVQGFGQKQPIAKAKTKAARAMNRRVEIGIVDTIIEYQKPTRN
jgi:outer membrane protein OmpA-like peptidoglycan-associated protein